MARRVGLMLDRLALLLFVLGVVVFSYLYGVASTRFSLFPYEIVRDAWLGGKALREAWVDEFDTQPPGALAFEPEPTGSQTRQAGLGAEPDRDLILVTGAPYELMRECPELGCFAWIMDRSGTVYHTWPVRRDEPWGKMKRHHGFTQIDNIYPEGLYLYASGDLLVSYQARDTFPYSVGLAKFDKNAKLLWQKESFSHHWFYVDRQGLIYAPSHDLIDSPMPIPGTWESLVCEESKIYGDVIIILDPDGKIVRKISVLQSLFDSGYGGLVYLTPSPCDPLHLNDVRLLTEDDASEYPVLSAGDMLISIRNLNTLAVMDPRTARIKWIASGLTLRQHSPRYFGANSILAFDNLGGPADKGGSRIAKVDLASHEVMTLFPRDDTPAKLNFFSEKAGHIDLNANRTRALVSLTMQGRILEIDLRTGDVLWQYDNTYDVTGYMESSGQGSNRRFARFGLNGAYYVGPTNFLSDDLKRSMAPSAAR